MKTKRTTRILSAFLAVVMVFLMIPFSSIIVSAADPNYKVPTTGHKLLSSYNALSGTDISSDGAAIKNSLDIFNRENLSVLFDNYSSYMDMHAQFGAERSGSDMTSFANSAGISISHSVGGNIGIEKLFKLSASRKFNISGDFSYSEAAETYFYEYTVNVQKGYYSFDESQLDLIKDYSNNYLSDAFINSLLNDSPETFFSKYGTHIITAYTAGGTAGVYASSIKREEDINVSIKGEYSKGSGSSGTWDGITLGIENSLGIKANVEGKFNTENCRTSADIYAYGGNNAVKFSSKLEFESWMNSVTKDNAIVLTDERLRFVPVWELLPKTGYEERELQLMQYFIEKSEEADNTFYTTYFGDSDFTIDYSKDWVGFDNAKIITDEEGLNDIRNDLRGVYVLANDIVLSKYANWKPIGSKEEPFRGRLYGNYNTISGLNISVESFDNEKETLIGLFGCNNGLISDVKIEGAISTPVLTDSNVYVASIAAYNDGIVNNCFDNVEYQIENGAVEYLKLTIPMENIIEDTTYTVGNGLGIYLQGQAGATYSNVNIVVEESKNVGPVYIILEDVNIVGDSINGTIYNPTLRPIYLISKGTNNTISGICGSTNMNGAPAIHTPNGSLYMLGNAELNVFGGNGGNGATGSPDDVDGKNGGHGHNAGNGASAIAANNIYITDMIINITGGAGGNGGRGGHGNNENWALASAKNGGDGGSGGSGACAIISNNITINKSVVVLQGGNGGAGGAGGENGKYGANEGKKGYGGAGGNGSVAFSNKAVFSHAYSNMIIIAGVGGNGGSGRSTGSTGESESPRTDMYIENKRYTLFQDSKTWNDAKIYAESLGGHLVTITDADEQSVIIELLQYGTINDFYIGAYRAEDDADVWAWVTGEPFNYTAWADGEPNNSNNKSEDYVGIYKDSLCWNDYPEKAYGYIVEYDLENPNFEKVFSFEGIVVACNTANGEEINSNNSQWNDNLLKIQAVTQTEYFSTSKLFDKVFDKNTVTVSYDDITEASLLEFSGSFATPGISAITVKYGSYERLIPIFVQETVPTKIEITTMPKTNYEIWNEFDISNLVIKATYNDGSIKENITLSNSDVKYTVPDMDSVGEKEVEISFFGQKTSYTITVAPKTINGMVEIIGTPEVNNTLSANIISINDESAKVNCSYQWFLNGVQQAKGETLPIKESMAGKTITLKVSFYGDYQGSFETTIDIRKKDQTAPSSAPTISYKTNTSVTLEEISGMEYTYCVGNVKEPSSDAIWQPSGIFEGLKPNTTYSFFMRKTENSTSYASASSSAVVSTTDKTPIVGEITLNGGSKVGDTLIAEIDITENAEFTYQWYRNDKMISGATSNQYTLCEADAGNNVYLVISGINDFNGNIQSNTVAVQSNAILPDTPQIIVDSKTATAGGKVQISVNLANNPGVVSMYLNLIYDTDVLELLSVEDEGLLKGKTFGQTLTSPYAITWDDSTAAENNKANGKIVTFTFKVKDDAELGTTTVSIAYNAGDIIDFDLQNVEFATVDGIITIVDYTPGDVNMDREVNAVDVAFVRRHLAGWEDYKVISTEAADVNKDGMVNATDVALLRRYLAKWDGIVLQ